MTRRLATATALAAVTAAIFGACSIVPAPEPDPSRFFVLSALSPTDASAAPSPDTGKLTIGLGPITFPEYLRRREVVTRAASNRVELSATEYWAEPLEESFQRVLGEDIVTVLGTHQILTYPWYNTTPIDYQVQVDVRRFERDGSGAAELAATAVIKDAKGRVLASQQFDLSQGASGAGGAAAAAALSTDLGNLSRGIAEMIRTQQSMRPATPSSSS
jgi:uncharacterized protein